MCRRPVAWHEITLKGESKSMLNAELFVGKHYSGTVNFLFAVRIFRIPSLEFMVGFFIDLNGKTNHKFPVTGYGIFERPRNSL